MFGSPNGSLLQTKSEELRTTLQKILENISQKPEALFKSCRHGISLNILCDNLCYSNDSNLNVILAASECW